MTPGFRHAGAEALEVHVKVLGSAFIALGLLGLIATLLIAIVFGAFTLARTTTPDARAGLPIVAAVAAFVLLVAVVLSLPALAVGWGLVSLRPWARVAGTVLAVLMLFNLPFGTIVGVYGLFVLCSRETGAVFERDLARSAPW